MREGGKRGIPVTCHQAVDLSSSGAGEKRTDIARGSIFMCLPRGPFAYLQHALVGEAVERGHHGGVGEVRGKGEHVAHDERLGDTPAPDLRHEPALERANKESARCMSSRRGISRIINAGRRYAY